MFEQTISEQKAESLQAKPQVQSSEKPEVPKQPEIKKADSPLLTSRAPSKFSITSTLAPKNEEIKESAAEAAENLPVNHFTDTDLVDEWQKYLADLKADDIVLYSAINGFKLTKKDENNIEICYPSESAKTEFEKVSGQFLNHFRHKVNNFKVNFTYRMDVTLKKEVITKKKLFDKFAEINPLLNDLNDLVKFDFS